MSNIEELRRRYVSFFAEELTPKEALTTIETALDLRLPEDFKAIAEFYNGGFLGGKSHHAINIGVPAMNLADETLRLRAAIGVAHRFVVLAEPPCSLIVLDVTSGEVIWCDACDVERLDDIAKMIGTPDVWPSYAAFLEFLLDEEERERRELE